MTNRTCIPTSLEQELEDYNPDPTLRVVMMPKDQNYLGFIFGGVILSMIDLRFLYSGLKSWPHSLIQWASSMATKEILTDFRNSMFSFLVNESGATYINFVILSDTSLLTCLNSGESVLG